MQGPEVKKPCCSVWPEADGCSQQYRQCGQEKEDAHRMAEANKALLTIDGKKAAGTILLENRYEAKIRNGDWV